MCLPMQAYIHYPDHDAASRALEALEGKPMALAGVKTVSQTSLPFTKGIVRMPHSVY